MPNACGWPGTSIQAGGSAYAARVPVDWLKSYDSFRPVPVWPGAGATEPLARAWLNFQAAASSKPATGHVGQADGDRQHDGACRRRGR